MGRGLDQVGGEPILQMVEAAAQVVARERQAKVLTHRSQQAHPFDILL